MPFNDTNIRASLERGHDFYVVADEALRVLEEVRTETDLEAYLGSLCRHLGFDYFSYVVTGGLRISEQLTRDAMLATSYPQAWRQRYRRHDYARLDPVVTVGSKQRRPFYWGGADYLRRLPTSRRRLFDEARDFGIRSGFTVPVHGPDGECGLLSTALDGRMDRCKEAVRGSYYLLEILGAHVHAVVVERLAPQEDVAAVRLTEQERICLSWTVRGKTSWEIAQIIGRSRPTVDFHLQKTIRKLGATNKLHAAFKALQAGLI